MVDVFQGNDLDDMWDCPFKYLVSRDHLIKYKNFASNLLYSSQTCQDTVYANCWCCQHSPADFEHIFWQCPQIQLFWQEVVWTLEEVTALPLSLTIAVRLLGLVVELAPLRAQKT